MDKEQYEMLKRANKTGADLSPTDLEQMRGYENKELLREEIKRTTRAKALYIAKTGKDNWNDISTDCKWAWSHYEAEIKAAVEEERKRIIDLLEKKDWFGDKLSPNQRLAVFKWMRSDEFVKELEG